MCNASSLKASLVPCDDPLVSSPDHLVDLVVVSTGGVASLLSGAVACVSGREDGSLESGTWGDGFGGIRGSALLATMARERRLSVQAFFVQLGCCDGSTSVAALEGTTRKTTRDVKEPVGGGGGSGFVHRGQPLLQQVKVQ